MDLVSYLARVDKPLLQRNRLLSLPFPNDRRNHLLDIWLHCFAAHLQQTYYNCLSERCVLVTASNWWNRLHHFRNSIHG